MLNDFLPLSIKEIEKGIGSFITINFKSGEYLWVYLCDWYIKDLQTEKILLDSEIINRDNCMLIFEEMTNCKLNDIEFTDDELFVFNFEKKFSLVLSKNLEEYEMSDELFMFFNEKNIISYSPKLKFFEENRNNN